ncbi:MAG: hypothetical protein WCT40_00565 [Candidatus Magasanikbacteria bacterium]|jgi:hypothetical protein
MNTLKKEEKVDLPEATRPLPESLLSPASPESITPETEQPIEDAPETTPGKHSTRAESGKPSLKLPAFGKPSAIMPKMRDEVTAKIEKLMSEDLLESYEKLSPVAKQEFKLKGEETADKIRELLEATNIKVRKIFRLIYEWLKMLPGINKFFLEQEAKIKTDKILLLKNKK